MRRLLAAERVRFGHRRDLWLVMILVPVVIGVIYLNDFNRTVQGIHGILNFDFGGTPDPDFVAQLQAQVRQESLAELPAFAFPASLLRIATMPIGIILLALYVSIALVAGEFEWGTVRTIHLSANRAAVLAVRIGLVTGLVAVALGAGLLIVTVLPLLLLSIDGTPLQQYAVAIPDLAPALGLRLLMILPFISIPILISVISRSTGLAFLLTVLLFVGDLAVTGTPIWRDSPVPWVPATTISGSISRLLGDETSALAAVAPGWYSVVALVTWSVLPVLAAIALFRRQDLNE